MPGRVLSEPEVQPAEVPARVALTGVPAGRVPATTKMTASGVAASASVLRVCGGEETDHGQQDRKDALRPHKEGRSSGHGLPHPRECDSSLLLFGWSGVLCPCRISFGALVAQSISSCLPTTQELAVS